MIRVAATIDELLADARMAHCPGQPTDYRVYENFKRRLQSIADLGTPEYDFAHRKMLDALEGAQ